MSTTEAPKTIEIEVRNPLIIMAATSRHGRFPHIVKQIWLSHTKTSSDEKLIEDFRDKWEGTRVCISPLTANDYAHIHYTIHLSSLEKLKVVLIGEPETLFLQDCTELPDMSADNLEQIKTVINLKFLLKMHELRNDGWSLLGETGLWTERKEPVYSDSSSLPSRASWHSVNVRSHILEGQNSVLTEKVRQANKPEMELEESFIPEGWAALVRPSQT